MSENTLINYMPDVIKEYTEIQEIAEGLSPEFKKMKIDTEEVRKQFDINTATWGLSLFEDILDLPIAPNKPYEERRAIIKSKRQGRGKISDLMIKSIIKAFTGTEPYVGFDGRIKISFTHGGTEILNLGDMFNAIEEAKPAHLGCCIVFNLKQRLSEICIATVMLSGEEITVYPYSTTSIESKGKVYVGMGSNTGLENVSVYPRKEVV